MKAQKSRWNGMLMMVIVALGMVAFSCDDDDDNNNNNNIKKSYAISGNANGSQMVPPNDSTMGVGTLTGTYNPNTRVLNYTNTWTGLSGAPTGGGFYNGANGVNGTALGSSWSFDSTATATGTYTGTMTLTQAQQEQLLAGNWYYAYNTANYMNGEVRGQIRATEQD